MSIASSADRALAEAVQLHRRGDLDGAIRLYKKVVRKYPGHAAGLNLFGQALSQGGELAAAASSFQKALSLQPDVPDGYFNLGVTLHRLGRYEEAAANLQSAVDAKPQDAEARSSLGAALNELGRNSEAMEQCLQAIALEPSLAGAHVNCGNALLAMHKVMAAIQHYETASRLAPTLADVQVCLCVAMVAADRFEEAVRHGERALVLSPGDADAHMALGNALVELGRRHEAAEQFRKAIELDPDHKFAFGALASSLLSICDWRAYHDIKRKLESRVAQGKTRLDPLVCLEYFDDPSLHFRCARNAIAREKFDSRPSAPPEVRRSRDRIRVAYLSSDIRRHAMAYLFAELFSLHDRETFEIIGISTGPDDGSELRSRIVQSFDRFHDVRFHGDDEIADLVRNLGADILVDLNGHTTHARFGVFARRPAPVQVTYLGYPGTTGADFIDYVVADPIVLPFDQQTYYSEKIVHLPDSYQANDSRRLISANTPTRRDAGLPDGFVFCCFNKTDKITPAIFDIWMQLLKRVDGSALWLIADDAARNNLGAEAAARGVNPDALVFVPRIANEDHLARHGLADLFLDTLPYNAHTTASDALWAGLPLVTCTGEAFAGRVAASLLHACDLPELVTTTLDEYEALAFRLATEPMLLKEVRTKLARNRTRGALFDAPRFCRHLESAYRTMMELVDAGEAPRGFAVQPISNR